MGCLLASRSSYRNASEMLSYLLKTVISPSSLQRMVKRFGAYISACEADWRQAEPAGKIKAPILYAESDGVWLHLQQAKTKRAEVKVGLLYSGKRRIGRDRFCCENKVVMTQLGGSNEEWQIKLRELADRHFDLSQTNYLVVGGDGATWVKHSFDLIHQSAPVLHAYFSVLGSGVVPPSSCSLLPGYPLQSPSFAQSLYSNISPFAFPTSLPSWLAQTLS